MRRLPLLLLTAATSIACGSSRNSTGSDAGPATGGTSGSAGTSGTAGTAGTSGAAGVAGAAGQPFVDPEHCEFEPAPMRAELAAPVPGQLRAGYASAVIDVPIGVPLGGYGGRSRVLGGNQAVDSRAARWSATFAPSAGLHDAPQVEVLAVEADGQRALLMRIDAPLITENALFELEEAVAPDGSMRGRILVTASHSHAAWAAWSPSFVLVPGMDVFRRDLHDAIVSKMANAASEALASLEPARIGFGVDMDFDPTGRVSRDRRGENDAVASPDGSSMGDGKDPMVWALRVDRANGSPLAAIVSIPIHGTVGEEPNPLVSTDAPGAIGRSMSQALGYPVMHFQGAAGDVSPAGAQGREQCPDAARCFDMPKLESIGARAAELAGPLVSGIDTSASAAFEIATRTFPVGRTLTVERPDGTVLSYEAYDPDRTADGMVFDDQGDLIPDIDEFNNSHGAALCGPGAGAEAYSGCADIEAVFPVFAMLYGLPADLQTPFCDTVRATSTGIRFVTESDDYLMLSVPGEPTAPYTGYLRALSPAGPERTLVVGYAQDYMGYVLTAEDWLAGGYEPSLNVWGPLEGEMVAEGVLDVASFAWTPQIEDAERGTSRFVDFQFPPVADVTITETAHGTVPTSLPAALLLPDTLVVPSGAQPDAVVPRAVGAARLVWLGGDPAIDFPEVVVEREVTTGQWEALVDSRGRAASSYDGSVVVTYTPDPIDAASPTAHYYVATWQPVPSDRLSLAALNAPFSLPLGKYRLRVRGSGRASGALVEYTVTSASFDVTSATPDDTTASFDGTSLRVAARFSRAPGMRALRDGISDANVPLPGPWTVTVTLDDSSTRMETVDPTDGEAVLALATVDASRAASVKVRDPAGNGAVVAVQ